MTDQTMRSLLEAQFTKAREAGDYSEATTEGNRA